MAVQRQSSVVIS